MTTLSIGTKLEDEYGIWIITNITWFDGDMWYDIKGESGERVLHTGEVKFYTIISKQ